MGKELPLLAKTNNRDLINPSYLKHRQEKKKTKGKYMKQRFSDTGYQTMKESVPFKMGNKQDEPYNCPSLLT